MAFFTRTQMTVPFLPDEDSSPANPEQSNKDSDSIEGKEAGLACDYVVDRTLGVEV